MFYFVIIFPFSYSNWRLLHKCRSGSPRGFFFIGWHWQHFTTPRRHGRRIFLFFLSFFRMWLSSIIFFPLRYFSPFSQLRVDKDHEWFSLHPLTMTAIYYAKKRWTTNFPFHWYIAFHNFFFLYSTRRVFFKWWSGSTRGFLFIGWHEQQSSTPWLIFSCRSRIIRDFHISRRSASFFFFAFGSLYTSIRIFLSSYVRFNALSCTCIETMWNFCLISYRVEEPGGSNKCFNECYTRCYLLVTVALIELDLESP